MPRRLCIDYTGFTLQAADAAAIQHVPVSIEVAQTIDIDSFPSAGPLRVGSMNPALGIVAALCFQEEGRNEIHSSTTDMTSWRLWSVLLLV